MFPSISSHLFSRSQHPFPSKQNHVLTRVYQGLLVNASKTRCFTSRPQQTRANTCFVCWVNRTRQQSRSAALALTNALCAETTTE